MSPQDNSLSSKNKKINLPNIALLGCGYWGKNLARNMYELGVLKLVCDPSDSCRKIANEIAPGVETSADFNEAINSKEINALVIATPAATHFDLVRTGLIAGKDIFVEKPLALDAKQGVELMNLAKNLNCILMVGHLLEYHPAVQKLRELIDLGELGNVSYIYSNRLNFGKVRTEENALWSFAPHDVAVILRLFGEMPIKASATGGSYITPGLEDVTISSLLFKSGCRAHIFVNWLNPFKEQKLVVIGNKRIAVFDDTEKKHKLTLYNQNAKIINSIPTLSNDGKEYIEIMNNEPLRLECEHFLDSVKTRTHPLTDACSGVQVLRVLEACQTSISKNGEPIDLKYED